MADDAGEKMLTEEWRCYFCGEVFTSREDAGDHFGTSEDGCADECACKLNALEGGLLKLYREALAELRTFYVEDNASARTFYALGADHQTALVREEEKGYARGLRDGVAESSATIKRLETPVADGEVEEAAVYVESWSTIQRSACLNDVADKSLSIASLLRRQARENANLAEGWHDAEVKLVEVEAKLSAALSLNSVETREMKP